MTTTDHPTTYTAPATNRTLRSVAFAEHFAPRVDSQGHPIGKPATFTYDPETGRLASVTVPPDDLTAA